MFACNSKTWVAAPCPPLAPFLLEKGSVEMSPKLLPEEESLGKLSIPELSPLVLPGQSSAWQNPRAGGSCGWISPQEHILSRKSTPCFLVALRKAQLILESDEIKMLHSWETHLYSRGLLAVNSLRLASTVVLPAWAAMYWDVGIRNSAHRYFKDEWSKYFSRQAEHRGQWLTGGINVLCSPNATAKVTKWQLIRSTKGKPVLWELAAKSSQQLSTPLLMGADPTVAQQSLHNSQKVWFNSDFSTTGIY